MDILSKRARSELMSRIRGKWTSPELRVHGFLKGNHIRHKMHPKLIGSPDIVVSGTHLVIFVHGCFWHKCPVHFKGPKTRKSYWIPKIKQNVIRDKRNYSKLKNRGYHIVVIWEHEVKEGSYKVKLSRSLKSRTPGRQE